MIENWRCYKVMNYQRKAFDSVGVGRNKGHEGKVRKKCDREPHGGETVCGELKRSLILNLLLLNIGNHLPEERWDAVVLREDP